jgi:hypothetical protein
MVQERTGMLATVVMRDRIDCANQRVTFFSAHCIL